MADHMNGFESGRYLSRSWALLTRDKGWMKPVLLLALVALIPIVGPIAVLGYCLEWARLVAWGVDAAPKQKRVDVGQILVSGLRGTVIGVVWGLAVWVIMGLVDGIEGLLPSGWWGDLLGFVLGLACVVVTVVVILAATVAQVRGAVYQKIAPGFRVDRVFEMVRHDLGGLVHMLGILAMGLLVLLGLGLAAFLLVLAVVIPYAVYGYLPGQYALISMLAQMFSSLAPVLVICVYVATIVSVITDMCVAVGVGLWMRQFDVPHWGKSADPLPTDAQKSTPDTSSVQTPGSAPVSPDSGVSGQPGDVSQVTSTPQPEHDVPSQPEAEGPGSEPASSPDDTVVENLSTTDSEGDATPPA